MLSLRARILRRGFALLVRVLRALRGGLPDPEAPEAEVEEYALRARAQLEELSRRLGYPNGVEVSAADGAPVRALWVVDDRARAGSSAPDADDPIAATDRVLLHLHGGAYCMGSPESHRGLATALSRTARAAVLLPEYRLTPEHAFPAALDDVVTTWDWLTRERGVAPSRIAVSGDSAGAGLAAALCVRLIAEDRGVPACLVGLSPWTDLAATGGSMVANATRDIWVPSTLVQRAARSYAGDTPLEHPLVSPLYADLTGLPPTLVHVGTDEVLLDDAVRFVAAAREHGVDASLGRFEGLWHVFHVVPGFPESRAALREVGAFVRRHTTPLGQQLAA